MVKHVSILDCTLRDGAYLIEKKFGDKNIRGIIKGLIEAKVDIIEVGFFQDDGFGEGKTVYKNSADVKKFIPENKKNNMFSVLADFSRYNVRDNLDEHQSNSVDAIRECFFKHELKDAIEYCRIIKEKGYKCFVQPVDILGYTDNEILELIRLVNEVEPYCLSIVDTFGSMYQEDLVRLFQLIDHNLNKNCKIGFHSHNNLQLSNALSQDFIRMSFGKREIVVDGTISGMGRGAGNTPTELIAQYCVSKLNYSYNIDALLDIIDDYMDNIRARCSWGYTTPFFVAGCFSAHVNNINYLMKKNSIRSKDVRFILNRIGSSARKRYDYELLENTYLKLINSKIDDTDTLERLKQIFSNQEVILLVPGNSLVNKQKAVKDYIATKKPIVISVNFIPENYHIDYLYISNLRRYNSLKEQSQFNEVKKIFTSNIKDIKADNMKKNFVISFKKLVKCGWEHIDNSTLMLLRLLDNFSLSALSIAGFDGYSQEAKNNYADEELELYEVKENYVELNTEIKLMFKDYISTRQKKYPISFITVSKFSEE